MTTQKKRNLFAEIDEGIHALKNERAGKLTLKSCKVKQQAKACITGKEIVDIRNQLRMSQAVFASALRVEKRTLERWEHGQGVQGPAAMLIKLVKRYPDTLERVANV